MTQFEPSFWFFSFSAIFLNDYYFEKMLSLLSNIKNIRKKSILWILGISTFIREVTWNAQKRMWKMILSCDGICIKFWNVLKSNNSIFWFWKWEKWGISNILNLLFPLFLWISCMLSFFKSSIFDENTRFW